MLPTSDPDRIDIAFDDDRLVDHAGLLLPATLAGSGSGTRSRLRYVMSGPTPPFPYEQPQYWSLLKLELLEKYSEAAAAILGSQGHRVTFVDLMAAEGYYASGDPGSTGRLASIAERNAAAGRTVRCIAYESNTTAFARLQGNVAHAHEWVDVRNARWEDHTAELLDELQGDFVVFFVDPMGLISWQALAPLAQRDHSEVMVNFSSTTAARLAGRWRKGGTSAAADAARLDEVFGGRRWTQAVEDASAPGTLHQRLAETYAMLLRDEAQYGVAWQPIAQRGSAGRPKYHIMFGSRHPKAFQVMNDVLASQSQRVEQENSPAARAREAAQARGQTLMDLGDAQSAEENSIERLATSLAEDELLSGRHLVLSAMFDTAMRSRFGEFRRTHYRLAASRLLGRGLLIQESGTTRGGLLSWNSVIEFQELPQASRPT